MSTADETFAGILGDRWQTAGDGIYRLADDADPEPLDEVNAHLSRPASPVRRFLRRARR